MKFLRYLGVSFKLVAAGVYRYITGNKDDRYSPHSFTKGRAEETVYDRVGSGVQRRQALNETCHRRVGLRVGHVPVNLKEVEHYVRAPAKNKH